MKTGFRLLQLAALLIAAVGFSHVAAAQSDDEEAAVAGDIEMAWIISAAARAAIEEVWRNNRSFPADRTETGMSPSPADTRTGPVAALDVTDGHVFVTFGGEAHPTLLGKTVVFSPRVTSEQSIQWVRNRSLEVPAEDRDVSGAPVDDID
ncbi:pilin [Lentisalinibacter orientalis]|uniref:pilin n=1 Tax=Lentisalinibacter orientalis TaxID=2992241 RepID=UPI003870CAFE